jgi:hypothetical protein
VYRRCRPVAVDADLRTAAVDAARRGCTLTDAVAARLSWHVRLQAKDVAIDYSGLHNVAATEEPIDDGTGAVAVYRIHDTSMVRAVATASSPVCSCHCNLCVFWLPD